MCCSCFLLQVISEAVRTTLGPRGMDKLMVDSRGEMDGGKEGVIVPRLVCGTVGVMQMFIFPGKATISNDGATILKLLDVVHPAAKTLVDIARSQDAEVSCLRPFVHQSYAVRNFRLTPSLSSGWGRHHLRHPPGCRVPEAAEVVRGGGSPPADHHQSLPHRHQSRRRQDKGDRRLCEKRR